MYLKTYVRTGIILIMILVSGRQYAQTQNLEGEIISKETKKVVANAHIINSRTQESTISDVAGKFVITGNQDDILKISHISYKDLSIVLHKAKLIEMELEPVILNEILVSNQKFQNSESTFYLTSEQIKNMHPTNVSELIQKVNGFNLVKRGNYAVEPVLRSFKYEQLNLQYNGGAKILSACPNRMDPMTTHIIPEEIEKIEVIKGPFSVRYGANFGGVVNLVSQSIKDKPNGISGYVNGGYETNGNSFITNANVLFKKEKFDFLVNGAYRDFGDYKDGNGTEVPASFRTTDYTMNFGWNPTSNQRLELNWKQSFSRDIKHAGLPMDSPFDDSYLLDIDYKIQELSHSVASFQAKLYYSFVDHLMDNANRPNFGMVEASSPVQVGTLGGKTEVLFNLGKQNLLYLGLDALLVEREGERTRLVKKMNGMVLPTPKVFVDKIWQDANIDDVGIFAEGVFKLSHNSSLNAGARVDFVSSGIDDPAADFVELYGPIGTQKEINASGHINYTYETARSTTQISVGRGTRTASMVERYINHFTVGIDPYEYVGNPFLKPEVNNQAEISSNYFWSSGYVKGTVFYSYLQDYISAVVNEDIPRKFMPTTPPVFAKQFVNIDKAMQYGMELDFGIELVKALQFSTKLAYVYAKNLEWDEPLPQIPPFSATLGLDYKKERYWLGINTRMVSEQNRIASSFGEVEAPSFTIVNFNFGVIPFENLTIGGTVENIFDEAYYEHLNYSFKNSNALMGKILEPGRNLALYLTYDF